MEPARPVIDQWVLRLLADHRFKASDFTETRKGICRLKPTITHWLAETALECAEAVAPHAENVANMLANTRDIRIDRIPTPLTGTNRSISRPPRSRKAKAPSAPPRHPHMRFACEEGRTQCEACLPGFQIHHMREMVDGAHERLKELREEGHDPAHGNGAAFQRGQSVDTNNRASHEWNRHNERKDPQIFTDEILPLLQDIPLSAMVKATGLSKGFCSFIKRGIKIPHERHWTALSHLGD